MQPYNLQLIILTLLILFTAFLGVFPSMLTGLIIDEGFIGGDFNRLVSLIGLSFLVLVGSGLVGLSQSYLSAWLSQNITKDMRDQMYSHLQKLFHHFFTIGKQGEIITRMTSDINGVEMAITGTFTSTISNVAVLVTSMVAMFRMNWILAIVGIMIVPLLIIPIRIVGNKRWELTNETQDLNNQANEIISETLSVSGQQLVKIYTKEEAEYQRFSATNEQLAKLKIRERTIGRWFRMVAHTLIEAGPMFIYLIGGILMLLYGYEGLTVRDITVLVALMTRMYRPLMQLMDIQVEFIRSLALFNRVFNYLELEIDIKSKVGAIIPESLTGKLTFEEVDFHYQEGSPILKDLSFEVEAGKTLAIVGPSGAGKSTIFNLIPRLYDVTARTIKID